MTLPEGITEYTLNTNVERETHEIHTSESRSFRGCKRRWDWAYRQGYVPKQQAKPLEFGIAFHSAMEDFYDPELWTTSSRDDKATRAVSRFVEECNAQQSRYLRETNQERMLQADQDDYAERIELGIGIINYYAQYIHPEQDKWFKPLMVEVPFRVPLTHNGQTVHCHTSPSCGQRHPIGAPVTFDGRVDMIVEDIYNGGYWIWDHKTAAQLKADDKILHLDSQVGGYSWALRTMLDIDVRGFVYAEYRKDYPKPPKLLSRPRNGCMFSTNKQQGTTLDMFLEHVQKFDKQGYEDGSYAEYIAWLDSKDAPRFHQRFLIVKTPAELENIGRNISMQASEMVGNPLIYPSDGQFSCSGCAYYDPCRGTNANEDVEYTLSTLYKKVK